MSSNKTSQSQLNAAHKYYQEHKDTINYKKREYNRTYSKQKYSELKEDDTMRQQRNEYYRNYNQKKKASLLNSLLSNP